MSKSVVKSAIWASALCLVGMVTVGVSPSAASGPLLSSVAAGWNHSCALTSTGGVKCWGYNGLGQLGDGTTTDRWTPVDVVGLGSGVTAITAGGNHTCALTSAGGVKCWGGNGFGGIGDGTVTDRWTPVDVTGLNSGATAVAAGAFHTCAIAAGGRAKCWGDNEYGGIGDGSRTDRWTPVDVSGLTSGWVAITAGGRQSCAANSTGAVKCWGRNFNGEVGDGTGVDRLTPVDAVGLSSGVTALTAGGRHTCALTSAGGVKCWGSNDFGQVGDSSGADRLAPVNVTGLTSGVRNVGAGRWHTCAVTTAGGVKCWGPPDGTGDIGDQKILSPVDIAGFPGDAVSLAGGDGHTCVRLSAGGARCFAQNFYGELGNGTTTASLTPVDVQFGAVTTSTTSSTTTTTSTPTTTVALPTLSIGDARVTEGNSGTTPATFTISLSKPSAAKVTVKAVTRDGTAVAPGDYTAVATTVTINPGQTSASVVVPVVGDLQVEAKETFKVRLSKPVNATVADATGVGVILNDD